MPNSELEKLKANLKRQAEQMAVDYMVKIARLEKSKETESPIQTDKFSVSGFLDTEMTLSEKLSMWKSAHDISDEALNDLIDILKSSGLMDLTSNLDSNKKQPAQPTEDNYLDDSNSAPEIKTEYPELDPDPAPQEPENVTLNTVLSKLNSLASVVYETSADVKFIKHSLGYINTGGTNPENVDMGLNMVECEDISEIIPDIKLPVTTKEDLAILETYLLDPENSRRLANMIKFEAVDIRRSLYCNFSSIAEKLISSTLASEYSLCGQRGKLRFLDLRGVVSFMKFTCKSGYENRNRLFTFSEIEQDKAIGSYLRYIKNRISMNESGSADSKPNGQESDDSNQIPLSKTN